jgi:C1A family cysteine protease
MSSLIYSIYNSIFGVKKTEEEFKRIYGWKKGCTYDKTDKMVLEFTFGHSQIKLLDFRQKCPPVYDQGKLGSCTANAIGFCYHFDELKQDEASPFQPSRLFIYYNERNMEGHVDTDSGAEIHDGIKTLKDIGVCSEDSWPYDITKFTEKPADTCFESAKEHRSIENAAIFHSIEQLKAALIAGFPVVFGFTVYESFESPAVATTGVMPMPQADEKILGGHAVALVGFDDSRSVFIVRNSWGDSWGDKGYFYMPYEFIKNPEYASDFWSVRKTKDL